MRFLKRLIGHGTSVTSMPEALNVADRRRAPIRCAGCGRMNPPYVFAENSHHYCLACARHSWKLMRLRPVARRREERGIEEYVTSEDGAEVEQAS
jgi:hypothetical protein